MKNQKAIDAMKKSESIEVNLAALLDKNICDGNSTLLV